MTLSEEEKRTLIKEYSRIAASKELRTVQNVDEIKAIIGNNKQHFSLVPRKLYKYRRFDEKNYTYDSINNDGFLPFLSICLAYTHCQFFAAVQ